MVVGAVVVSVVVGAVVVSVVVGAVVVSVVVGAVVDSVNKHCIKHISVMNQLDIPRLE